MQIAMAKKTISLFFLILTWYAGTSFQSEQGEILNKPDNEFVNSRKPFNLEEIYEGYFHSEGFNGIWISDTEIFYTDEFTDKHLILDVVTMKSKPFLNHTDIDDMSLSNDRKYSLVGYNRPSVSRDNYKINRLDIQESKIFDFFQHASDSPLKKYEVYDIEKKKTYPIANGANLSYAQWSPTGKKIIFGLNNNIYYTNFDVENNNGTQLPNNSVSQIISNGVADSFHEEKVFQSEKKISVSPDGNYLAFVTSNETGVKRFLYPYYGDPGSLKYQYPREMSIRYPKVNTPNTKVTLNLINLNDPNQPIISLKAPEDVVDRDHILISKTWLDEKRIAVIWTNRVQNRGQLMIYDTVGGAERVLYLEETNGWLEYKWNPIYHDGYLILVKPQESNTDAGKFHHVTRYNYNGGHLTEETDLTPGTIEVQKLIGIDKLRGRVYYLGSELRAPSQRNLYSVLLNGTFKPECISCNVITPEGNNCTYASVSFSKNMSNYALSCTGPDPTVVRLYNSEHQELLVWEENVISRVQLKHRILPQIRDLYVKSHGFESKVRLYLPKDFDEKKKYPLLVDVYGGPNSVTIKDESRFDLESYMTTNKSVIYARIDGRGSANRGTKLLYQIYRRLGSGEVEDQITVTKYLQETYPWIDANRTGIWGWSYGGYVTAMTLATDTEKIFQCGISVAPVSSWIYSQSIYTERYMGLPVDEDNLIGYNKSDITRLVDGMRGKKFMIIHGTADVVVHYQQAMALVKALQSADIPFELMTYVDQDHQLNGVTAHLYHTMDRFWNDCFRFDS